MTTNRSRFRRIPARELMFSPLAWLKLQYFCHAGDTEIGGFGIAAEDDPLHVVDFQTVRQQVTSVTVRFADDAVADFFDKMTDGGLPPARYARLWCHTHPGTSADPSGTDEETFARVFGGCDWSVMFILARGGETYARLAFSAGPRGELLLPVSVDWSDWPDTVFDLPELVPGWREEFERNIEVATPILPEKPLTATDRLALDPLLCELPWWENVPWAYDLDGVHYGLSDSLTEVEDLLVN